MQISFLIFKNNWILLFYRLILYYIDFGVFVMFLNDENVVTIKIENTSR